MKQWTQALATFYFGSSGWRRDRGAALCTRWISGCELDARLAG